MKGIVQEIRERLAAALESAVNQAAAKGLLPVTALPPFTVEVPREKEHGDFAANLAMLLARAARSAPRRIAEVLVNCLDLTGIPVEKVEVAGPGFINFYLHPRWVLPELPRIVQAGDDYGRADVGGGMRVQVEFVSANPTGLLHMGNARGAALGDSIAAILEFAGYRVTREYYINDAGNQIENFARSLEARYLQLLGRPAEVPEEGYHGEDLIDTARNFVALYGDRYLEAPAEERRRVLAEYALKEKLAAIRRALEDFGVRFDVWFSEQSLHDSGEVEETIAILRERGYLYEHEGALWFRATAFGAEKDEVLVRKNGVPTYFAADIAYHRNKFRRGFERIINIWGADHHGHVARMKGAVAALGYDPGALEIVIMQLVRLYRGGELVRMSKRTGRFVTLEELVEEVGRDAARYFFVMRSADSHLDFDLDLAKAQSNENPVYYIQYAHARICSILRQNNAPLPPPEAVDLGPLETEAELALARRLADFPEEVVACARDLAPHRLARYLHEVAGLFHSFYNSHRVLTADRRLTEARLLLAGATRVVLKNGLRLLGLSAPERM
ncbi:arginine--tRNA ligase [Desulfovirgula thermocuniculi]|uniref:arginine--tRNA ligase n=1 Tax=Desulfovirgula thermocuniculi TaxID=348842 RepID=UPI000423B5F3|nr:arginine--tRNA ligase [Desulfovirgula thermocuniculi]